MKIKWKRRLLAFGAIGFLSLCCCLVLPFNALAASSPHIFQALSGQEEATRSGEDIGGAGEMAEKGLEEFDFSQVQQMLEQSDLKTSLSFTELIKELMAGNLADFLKGVGQSIKNWLFAELTNNFRAVGQVIMICAVGAIFANFSSIFAGSQISETGFYITYLLLVGILAAAFAMAGRIAGGVMDSIVSFMNALVPSYFLAVAYAGGSISSVASYQFTLFIVYLVERVLAGLLVPMVNMYVLLVFVNNISKEDALSKLAELLKTAVEWSLKTLLGLVTGFHIIQSLILPQVDAIKSNALQKVISVIPGVGQGASALANLVLGSGVLIKNGIGGAALVVLVLLCAVPILKLAALSLMYQGASAVVQPVSDKRVVECVACIADGCKLLLKIVFTSALLFLITIAVVCLSTNVSYYAG